MVKKAPLFLLLVIFLSACVKDILDTVDKASKIDGVKWNPTLAVPLVYADLGMDDVVKKTGDLKFVKKEDDRSITLVYSSSLFSLRATDVFQLPDQVYSNSFNLNASDLLALNNTDSVRVKFIREFDFGFSNNELDSIRYRSGQLQFIVTNGVPQKITADFKILGSNKGGNPIRDRISLNYTDPNQPPPSDNTIIGLNNASVDFTLGPQNHSEFTIEFDILIEMTNANPVSSTDQIQLDLEFRNQQYKVVHGYLESQNISNGTDTLKVAVFNQTQDGSFTLADPRAKLKFTNSFGIPIEASILQADGRHVDGTTVSLNGYPDPLPIPILSQNEVGQEKSDSLMLNRNNSNLADYINNEPYTNIFEYDIATNPAGPAQRNWITDSSVVECTVELEIPLYGTASNYALETDAPFELSLTNIEQIDTLMMRIYTENGYPIEVGVQVYFEDSVSGIIYDSLLVNNDVIFPAANVDAAGKVSEIYPQTLDVPFDWPRIQNISEANRVRLKATFNSLKQGGNMPDVKIYEFYNLLFQLGLQAEIEIDE
ncbi:hypothetical protein GYB22_09080 [bacterium]|nr:hypothetical protein [bacterium]